MNREYITEHDIISRYVAGVLPEEEADAFELAFFNDEELAAMVLVEQRLRSALASPKGYERRNDRARGQVLGEPVARRQRTSRRGLLARAVAVAAVVLPTAWLLGPWQEAAVRTPRVLTQVLSLHAARDRSGIGSGPSLPASTASDAVVALHIDTAQVPSSARSAVLIPDGLAPQALVAFEQTQIDQSNGLIIEIPASRLPPGVYVLELRDGEQNTVQSLPFRMTLPDSF